VFDVVALILQGVEGLVFNLPAASPYLYQLFDVAVYGKISYPTIVIGGLSMVEMPDGPFLPLLE